MRFLCMFLAIQLATSPAIASDPFDDETVGGLIKLPDDPIGKMAGREFSVAFRLLSITYICRESIGSAHFQAAREISVGRLAPYSSHSEALARKYVVELTKIIENAATDVDTDIGDNLCMERINNIYFEMNNLPVAPK